MTLHWFNPQNDLALAADAVCYTPRAAVAAFAREGALLPLWWAEPDDYVLGSKPPQWWIDDVYNKYGLKGTVAENGVNAEALQPWGWSRDAAYHLGAFGPVPNNLAEIRSLSHRRTSIAILTALGYSLIPRECKNLQETLQVIDELNGQAVIKTPWSCSSRGVRLVSELTPASLIKFLDASIRRTGSVIVEHLYDKCLDFAALFKSNDGVVSFLGWSVFKAGENGLYFGNIVDSQQNLIRMLPAEALKFTSRLEGVLTTIVGNKYNGVFGIDMLVTHNGEINPCVEMNLRRTMGHLAMDIYQHTGITGLLNSMQHDSEPLIRVTPRLFRVDRL